jgi:hypothetical protein
VIERLALHYRLPLMVGPPRTPERAS